jgi:Lon protease-like protein
MMNIFPLFPLPLVLFPGGKLPLQIFEARYVDMVSESLRNDCGFGIVLIEQGDQVIREQAAPSPQLTRIGTYVKIVDFDQLPNGLLSIVVQGTQKFTTLKVSERDDRLMIAEAEFVTAEEDTPIPEDKTYLAQLLARLVEHEAVQMLDLNIDFNSAPAVSCRLAELLPIPNDAKQHLLELEDPLVRINELASMVNRLQQSNHSE